MKAVCRHYNCDDYAVGSVTRFVEQRGKDVPVVVTVCEKHLEVQKYLIKNEGKGFVNEQAQEDS